MRRLPMSNKMAPRTALVIGATGGIGGAIAERVGQAGWTVRVQMERALRDAADGGLEVLIVRCGDFFGPAPGNNWLSQGLVQPGKPIASVRYPGPPGVAHSWAYLPDVAETVVRLLALPDLGR